MTKKQGREDAAGRLTRAAVIDAALQVLEERGLEGLSTRAVADALGVRMNTVLWHMKTKARMLELLADAIVGEIGYADLPSSPLPRARELAHRYRRALLAHRDGAALMTGTYPAEPHTLRFADGLISALLEAGADEEQAAWTAWTVIYFLLGLVQEEQAAPGRLDNRLAQALEAGTYPALHRVVAHMGHDAFESRFTFGLDAILAHLAR
ncbi:TetR/AcrR family transcriptional regulator C-terminal domain-containing protein [Streptomyces sp. NBC_00083]|uniref:TetR/AcrR family transcriptional regulator C-terminal domain-containing protein n=1 Tax=Streptomyces sp. NBC_00083 TaxID=2975647 RepID=UPI00224F2316|nr:TetR/AcrR family transcriptional regulator C-terminal domain-containing protein [Streptomyces sp. NBC_00083]MCX5384650.1 TetR/AcrR family transcriptional regulator C-terminal domain-containing protein [Streptomyces sp. NBC_00083]